MEKLKTILADKLRVALKRKQPETAEEIRIANVVATAPRSVVRATRREIRAQIK
jgi:hypothetical protein